MWLLIDWVRRFESATPATIIPVKVQAASPIKLIHNETVLEWRNRCKRFGWQLA
ncbi:MAG: hypothetical protein ACRCV6_00535 [Formosimonas sp.]